jgi:hypothetical protein
MKIKAIAIALVILGSMAACTQKTCPTYTKGTQQPVQVEVRV